MTPLGDEWIVGRDHELALLSRLVDALTTGRTGALLMTGGPGAGKSALLDAAARMARRSGVRVLRCRGSEGESGLAFAGLHQLLRPFLDLDEGLPTRQRAALLGVFGLDDGTRTVSDPLLTSLGALTLLSDAAEHGPLLLVIDDTHWLDLGTLDVLAFMARRLEGEPVALLLAARDTAVPAQLDRQIDRLTIEPLDPAAAGRLLDRQPRPPAGRARSRVLEQAAGVPLALVELARAVARDPAAAHEDALPLTDRLEAIFAADLPELPPVTRALLLFAAAAESAELPVILSAVGDRATPDDWLPAERAGLVRIDADRVRFRHPLIRSAVYRAATYTERRTAHRARGAPSRGGPPPAAPRAPRRPRPPRRAGGGGARGARRAPPPRRRAGRGPTPPPPPPP
ncbi:AAA family ATPase, partial [Streptomyces mirabilis]|uniref:AAA family ATPase n=1 Tax=Streptomyces mirabilis TaxID=68239 RepID=UPI00368F271A